MKYTTGLSGNCVDLYDALVTTHHTQEHIKKNDVCVVFKLQL